MLKAIGHLFQKKPTSAAFSDYLRWRDVVFSVNSLQVGVAADQPNQVYGVILDVVLADEFIMTTTAFASGESSLRTTIGGGTIGLGGDEHVAEHARRIVSLAQPLLATAKSIRNHNLPKSKRVYFYFLTTSGVTMSESTFDETYDQSHPYHEMYARFLAIKTRSEELTKAYNP
jgi:hypothetical protein